MHRLFVILITFVLLACGNGRKAEMAGSASEYTALATNTSEEVALMDEAPDTDSPVTERKLIKTGDVRMEVDNLIKTKSAIEALCIQHKAYIASESQQTYDDRRQHTLEIRIPATHFDSLLSSIEQLALKVENKSVNVQDVTEEFIDVEARLKTKKELEIRYLELLRKASKVEDILSIENHLADVRSEIESMQGRLKYLSSQVSYSTLSVTSFQLIQVDYGFGTQLMKGFSTGWHYLLEFTVLLVNIWPFILLTVGGVLIFIRIKKTKMSK